MRNAEFGIRNYGYFSTKSKSSHRKASPAILLRERWQPKADGEGFSPNYALRNGSLQDEKRLPPRSGKKAPFG